MTVAPSSCRATLAWLRVFLTRCVLAVSLLLTALSAAAQTDLDDNRVVARRMAEEAADRYESGDFEGARDLFHRANVLYPAPTLELWEARALEKVGRLVEAEERYTAVQRYEIQPEDPDVVRAAVREAGAEVVSLRRRVPTLTIVLRGADPNDPSVEVQLDGRRVNPAMLGFPKPVDPGQHAASLFVNKNELIRLSITATEGDRKPIELDVSKSAPKPNAVSGTPRPKPTAPPPPTPDRGLRTPAPWYTRPTTGWISIGAGAAGLAAGAATGLAAVNKHRDLDKHCRPDGKCPEPYWRELDTFHALENVSTVCYVVGGLGVAAGLTVLVVLPTQRAPANRPPLALALGPTSAVLSGSF